MADKAREMTVEALLEVSYGDKFGHKEQIRQFDKTWAISLERAKEHGLPIRVKFLDFVRKDQ